MKNFDDQKMHVPQNSSFEAGSSPRVAKSKIVLIIIGVLAALATIGAFAFFFFVGFSSDTGSEETEEETKQETFQVLLNKNASFVAAEQQKEQRNFSRARTLYEEALQEADSTTEQGQIFFRMAQVTSEMNAEEGVAMLKELVNETQYDDLQRAYAIQQLGQMRYRYPTENVSQYIFNESPFIALRVEGNEDMSFRNLFEYATDFYPLAISELRVAKWYADELLEDVSNNRLRLSDTDRQEYQNIIDGAVERADQDIARTRGTVAAGGLIPEALAHKASVLATLYEAGYVEDSSIVTSAFEEALSAGLVRNNDATARYYFAIFLAHNTDIPGAKQKLEDLLEEFYGDSDRYITMRRAFENEKNNLLGEKENVLQLVQESDSFRQFLLELGWEESDFE